MKNKKQKKYGWQLILKWTPNERYIENKAKIQVHNAYLGCLAILKYVYKKINSNIRIIKK